MSIYYVGSIPYTDELTHHGIKGMHWYVRRYQNPDGTLTEEGKARYLGSSGFGSQNRKIQKALNILDKEQSYYRGDKYTNEEKIKKLTKREYKITAKHPENTEKLRKTKEKLNEAHKMKASYLKRISEIDTMKKAMEYIAKNNNMNIKTYATIRTGTRPGKQFANECLAWAGAFAMASVAPVGIGFVSNIRVPGTRYKVRKNT